MFDSQSHSCISQLDAIFVCLCVCMLKRACQKGQFPLRHMWPSTSPPARCWAKPRRLPWRCRDTETPRVAEGDAGPVCRCVCALIQTQKQVKQKEKGGRVTEALSSGSEDTLEAQWRICDGWSKWDTAADSPVTTAIWGCISTALLEVIFWGACVKFAEIFPFTA